MANPTDSDHPADMARDAWLRLELAMLSDEIAQMVDVGSWQAAMAGRRLALQYRTELDKLAQPPEEEVDLEDPDQVVAEVLKLPDWVFTHPDVQERVDRCR